MAGDFDIRYDRRVTDEFLKHFTEDGFAQSLVSIAKGGLYPLDLRLRRDPKSGAQHVSLYTGLTAVLQVAAAANGTLRLKAHKSHQKAGTFDPSWLKPRSADEWEDLWPSVELYLERIIPLASASHGRTEGAVQAAIASHRSRARVVIDREVTPSFRDKKLKEKILNQCQNPIMKALPAADLGFSGKPKSLGNECDALAVDADGRVLAIEVKPLVGGSIAWVAAQASMYARILQAWIDHEEESPRDVLRGMLDQRRALGLAPEFDPPLAERPTVVPVVALQRGASPEMIRRMLAVRDAVAVADPSAPRVEIYEVSLIGELLPLDESRAANGAPKPIGTSYVARANAHAAAWKESALPEPARSNGQIRNRKGERVEVPYVLPTGHASYNLLPEVRDDALDLFAELKIPWHMGADGLPSPHLRSSQVQCANALTQMVSDPDRIRRAFGGVLDIGEVRDFGEIDATEAGRYMTFEYIGPKDYFGEGRRTRGAQCTSVDAAFAYRTSEGLPELALVEWKYTESYRSKDYKADSRLKERTRRYAASIADPHGPIRADGIDVGDLFHEPIYQLTRQQLLAWRLETDPDVAAERVRVVHVLSPENHAYEDSYVAPGVAGNGGGVSHAWQSLLRTPDRFVKLDPEVFLDPQVTSAAYMERYQLDGN